MLIHRVTKHKAFMKALDRTAAPWTKSWDEPKYLPDFLMPTKRSIEN